MRVGPLPSPRRKLRCQSTKRCVMDGCGEQVRKHGVATKADDDNLVRGVNIDALARHAEQIEALIGIMADPELAAIGPVEARGDGI